jgi:hypothetical protein
MGGGPGAMAAGALLSDEQSKTRITELEDELQRTYAALGGKASTADVSEPIRLRQQMAAAQGQGAMSSSEQDALDAAFRKPTSNSYEYKDPSAPGAAPGRHAGPMADELKGIPGVVETGPDGMDRVNGPRLELANTSEIANLRRELDALKGQGAFTDAEERQTQQFIPDRNPRVSPSQDPRISDEEKARMMADMGAIR